MWGKGEDEQDRTDSLLISSIYSFISDDVVHDVEYWRFTWFGNFKFGFRVQGEIPLRCLDILVLRGEN